MQLQSVVDPHYLPETDQQSVLRLGLHAISLKDWLHLDADFLQFYQHKQQQESLHCEKVYAALEESAAAQTEFAEFLLKHLLQYHSKQFVSSGQRLQHQPTGLSWEIKANNLWQSALWIQDDICLLQEIDNSFVLAAASLCSPSNWKLEDKIGQTLDHIHHPVPGYEAELGTRVNKLMHGLAPGKPVLRYNWSVQRGNELCWREDVETDAPADDYFWRVERQTLLKLPDTGCVVFGIRLFLHDFKRMQAHSDFHSRLQKTVQRMPADMLAYKGIEPGLFE